MTTTPAPVAASVEIAAPPARVWEALADPRRMPEFSPELRKAFVIGSGEGALVIGINRRGPVVWPTTSRIVRWEPERAVAWHTRESGATWVYELEPTPTGTRVSGRRELARHSLATRVMAPIIGGAVGHDQELAAGIRTTLERIRAALER